MRYFESEKSDTSLESYLLTSSQKKSQTALVVTPLQCFSMITSLRGCIGRNKEPIVNFHTKYDGTFVADVAGNMRSYLYNCPYPVFDMKKKLCIIFTSFKFPDVQLCKTLTFGAPTACSQKVASNVLRSSKELQMLILTGCRSNF